VKKALKYAHSDAMRSYGFEVGEHVFVDGRDGEFIVREIDRSSHTLQVLPAGRAGRIETVPAASVRIVMPPKSKVELKRRLASILMVIPPLPDVPHLRDRVTVVGQEGIYIVIAYNSSVQEVDLAGASHPGYLFGVPVSSIRPVPDVPVSRMSRQTPSRLAPMTKQ
jgi:hypothetical protein